MNLIDVVIILLVVSSIFRGREIGFIRQLFSTVGFFGGLWLGTIIAPHVIQAADTANGRSFLTIVATLGSAFIMLSVGEYIGILLKTKVTWKRLNQVDSVLGAGLAVVSVLLGVWLSAAISLSLPFNGLQTAVRSSGVIRQLNSHLPSATTTIANLGHLIDPNGFPQVFSGGEPIPNSNVPLPDLGSLEPAVRKVANSVVKIEGQGCGGIVEGSGFVAANGLVATNAHVVAGIRDPLVVDGKGTHNATLIWFDPNLDFAVLRVSGLAGAPLTIRDDQIARGTAAAVLGYPGGGAFTAKPAAVLNEYTATGRNIYNRSATNRDIYELKADIIPGNSGGPLIDSNGDVIGIVFAQSTSYNSVGYALQTDAVIKDLSQARAQNHIVSSGSCAE